MLNYNLSLINILFFSSCLMFSYFYKHLLLTLIALEFIMLNMSITIYMFMYFTKLNMMFMSLYLTMMICESILGLCMLILIVRNNGNDYMKMLTLI